MDSRACPLWLIRQRCAFIGIQLVGIVSGCPLCYPIPDLATAMRSSNAYYEQLVSINNVAVSNRTPKKAALIGFADC